MRVTTLLFVVLSVAAFVLPAQATNLPDIAESAAEATPLQEGQSVPEVSVTTLGTATLNLHEVVKQKPTVILFYRGGWCPYCNAHLGEMATIEDELVALGYQVLAISPQTPQDLKSQSFDTDSRTILLADDDLDAIRGFGLAFFLDAATSQRYRQSIEQDLATVHGDERVILPVPAAYVVDTQGVIRYAYTNPDYQVRVSPEQLLDAAQAALTDGD